MSHTHILSFKVTQFFKKKIKIQMGVHQIKQYFLKSEMLMDNAMLQSCFCSNSLFIIESPVGQFD